MKLALLERIGWFTSSPSTLAGLRALQLRNGPWFPSFLIHRGSADLEEPLAAGNIQISNSYNNPVPS
jgi:hypothetical protein